MPTTRPHATTFDTLPASAAALRAHLAEVTRHREAAIEQGLGGALATVRHVQIQRFRAFYADLLVDPRHAQATHFFLAELYGAQDYTERDAQFARIAGAVERLFPAKVMTLAVELAEVHALTEELDWRMAHAWQALGLPLDGPAPALSQGYTACWAQVGRQSDRQHQLDAVLRMGWRLADVVGVTGLRTALRLMRPAARAAGLSALQHVLEEGFDAFKSMGTADTFLGAIATREGAWLDALFDAPAQAAAQLTHALRANHVDELSETRP